MHFKWACQMLCSLGMVLCSFGLTLALAGEGTGTEDKPEMDLPKALAYYHPLGVPGTDGMEAVLLNEKISFMAKDGKEESMEVHLPAWLTTEEENTYHFLLFGVVPQYAAKVYELETSKGKLTIKRTHTALTEDNADQTRGIRAGIMAFASQLQKNGKEELARKLLEQSHIITQQAENQAMAIKKSYAELPKLLLWRELVLLLDSQDGLSTEKRKTYLDKACQLKEEFAGAAGLDWDLDNWPLTVTTMAPQEKDGEDKNAGIDGKAEGILQALEQGADLSFLKNEGVFPMTLPGNMDAWREYLILSDEATDGPVANLFQMGPEAIPSLLENFDSKEPVALLLKIGSNNTTHYSSHISGHKYLKPWFSTLQPETIVCMNLRPACRGDLARRAALAILPGRKFHDHQNLDKELQQWLMGDGAGLEREQYLRLLVSEGENWQVEKALSESENPAELAKLALSDDSFDNNQTFQVLSVLAKKDPDKAKELIRANMGQLDDRQAKRIEGILISLGDEEAIAGTVEEFRNVFGRGKKSVDQQQMGMMWQTIQNVPDNMRIKLLNEYKSLRPDGLNLLLWVQGDGDSSLSDPMRKALGNMLDDKRILLSWGIIDVRTAAAGALISRAIPNGRETLQSLWKYGIEPSTREWVLAEARRLSEGKEPRKLPLPENADQAKVGQAFGAIKGGKSKEFSGFVPEVRRAAMLKFKEDDTPAPEDVAKRSRKIRDISYVGQGAEKYQTVVDALKLAPDVELDSATLINLKKNLLALEGMVAVEAAKHTDGSGLDIVFHCVDEADLPPAGIRGGISLMLLVMRGEQRACSNRADGARMEGPMRVNADGPTVAEMLSDFDSVKPWESYTVNILKLDD